MPSSQRIFAAILLLGACAQVLQALLIREGLTVFYCNEISLGAFYAGWLFWLAIGSMLVVRWGGARRSLDPLPWLRRSLLLLPLFLIAQVLALRTVRLLLDVSLGQLVPLGDLFLSLFVITAPSGLVIGIAFPLACRALEMASAVPALGAVPRVGIASRLYLADALGALVGGLLFTFVLVRWAGVAQTLALVTLCCAAMVLGLCARSAPCCRATLLASIALATLGLLVVLAPASSRIEHRLETLRFQTLQPGLAMVTAAQTRYGHRAVARLGDQYSLVADGQVSESFPLPLETAQQAAYVQAQAAGAGGAAKRVLLLEGFAGGLAAELLRWRVQRLDQVEQDRVAFDLVRAYLDAPSRAALDDSRLHLHFADGRRFLARLPADERYDLILALSATPSSATGNRYFTQTFYTSVRDHLSPGGVFCTRVSAASNYLGETVGGYLGSVYRTLSAPFAEVAIMPGDEVTLCASPTPGQVSEDPEVLEERYLALPLAERRFPAEGFRTLLPASDIAYVRERLARVPADINTDARPVTYYLNMVLWGSFSGSGFVAALAGLRLLGAWPYLLPPVLFVLLWLLRSSFEGFSRPVLLRRAGTFGLFVLGIAAMAAQLVVLFGYQARVGFMFERVALLNGLFMTGLALGAGIGQRLARGVAPVAWLLGLLVATALVLLAVPWAVERIGDGAPALQEPGFLMLALLLGLLTGTGFPLTVLVAELDLADVLSSGGMAQAADNLGGAVGGLVAGALMVPLLGIEGTCRVLAALLGLSLLPLLFARWMPERNARLTPRGFRSFPGPVLGPNLGWALILAVLITYAWHWLDLGLERGATLRFDEASLATLADGQRFELVEQPFPHYLGHADKQGDADLVALSSMAAAADVRGFAGPLNLLLAVDRDGVLRGLRYIDSDETPAYIAGIDDWLQGLRGQSLAGTPLSLDRFDGLSGATVTSRAALAAINQAAGAATGAAFGRAMPPRVSGAGALPGIGFYVTLALLAAFIPVFLAGGGWARLGFLAASLAILGVWMNTPLTEIDLVNLSLGQVATPVQNPQRWLLIGFAGVSALLLGPVWCGYLCPFGALQECASWLGWRLGLRGYVDRHVDDRLRYLKYVLLAAMLVMVYASGDALWAGFDPMQHAFGNWWRGHGGLWMGLLLAIVVVGSLFHFRLWCRYLCPMGAMLALGNKVALLQHLAPRRRFEHCDLGVRGEFDLDCIRCNRCVNGIDTRLRAGHGHLAGRSRAATELEAGHGSG